MPTQLVYDGLSMHAAFTCMQRAMFTRPIHAAAMYIHNVRVRPDHILEQDIGLVRFNQIW